jgi:hypothetical protein
MKERYEYRYCAVKPFLCLLLGVCLVAGALPAMAQAPQRASNILPPPKWPMEFLKDGTRLIIYQPQLQDWQKFRELTSDTAISITPSGGKPVLGVVSWHATTLTDTQARIVVIKDIVLTSARFPSLNPAASAPMERLVRATYPATVMTISLDRILAGFEAAQAPPPPVVISTQPPPIFVSTRPAVLLFVDGQPIRVPIEGTKLEFVANTTWNLFYDKSNYYLLSQKTWLKAKELSGPWNVTTKVPSDMAKLPADGNWDDVKRAVLPLSGVKSAPQVFFTNKPAALLLFKGEPVYVGIRGTQLAYAANTDDDVFLHGPDRQVYVLLSGRWFRAATLQGPWAYASNDLPLDFAKIPADHARAHVLASVPGTQAAHDAVLLAQVPTTAIVNRSEAEAKVKVVYSGEPQFKPIESTSLSYAANTQDKVIKVGDLYYLCFQGVWFMATSPNGPWKTADSVPKQIYEIPPSAPLYNITYVTQTNPTPTTVESSYTAGYMGMFVLGAAVGACIAYGSGYYYPPYYYWGPHPWPVYYPYPYSYGFRAVYNPATGFYGRGGVVYGPYGSAGRAAWYNPSTGAYGRAASVQTAYGGRTVAQGYNPYTGTYGATAQGHNAYSQWGSSVVSRGDDWVRTGHVSTDQGTVARYKTSEGGSGTIISGPGGKGGVVKTADNTVYAGKDGNVYKRDANGNWNKYNNGNWDPVQHNTSNRQQQRGESTGVSRDSVQERAQSTGVSRDATDQLRQEHQAKGQPSAADLRSQAPGRSAVSADTMQQLNHDAHSRQQGAMREQAFSRGSSGGLGRAGRRR